MQIICFELRLVYGLLGSIFRQLRSDWWRGESDCVAQTNLDASKKAFSAGTAMESDVLIALSKNMAALRDYSKAKFQYAMEWVALEMDIGSHLALQAPQCLAPFTGTILVDHAQR